jgi:hypothetical protein
MRWQSGFCQKLEFYLVMSPENFSNQLNYHPFPSNTTQLNYLYSVILRLPLPSLTFAVFRFGWQTKIEVNINSTSSSSFHPLESFSPLSTASKFIRQKLRFRGAFKISNYLIVSLYLSLSRDEAKWKASKKSQAWCLPEWSRRRHEASAEIRAEMKYICRLIGNEYALCLRSFSLSSNVTKRFIQIL